MQILLPFKRHGGSRARKGLRSSSSSSLSSASDDKIGFGSSHSSFNSLNKSFFEDFLVTLDGFVSQFGKTF